MRRSRLAIYVFFITAVLFCGAVSAARADDAPRITTDELKARLGDADLTVLDVRTGWDWNQSTEKIAGAVRVDPRAVQEWAGNYPKDRMLVLYCA